MDAKKYTLENIDIETEAHLSNYRLRKVLLLNPFSFSTDYASFNYILYFPVHCHLTRLISTAENVAIFKQIATGFLFKSSIFYNRFSDNSDTTCPNTMKQWLGYYLVSSIHNCAEQYLYQYVNIRMYFHGEGVLNCKQELISTLYRKFHQMIFFHLSNSSGICFAMLCFPTTWNTSK